MRIFQEKTNALVAIPKHSKLENHLDVLFEKYPQGFPVISNQKFNDYLKEICELAKFNQKHQWVKLVGKQKVTESDFRYNLITSHTGRRTFCTIALKKGIDSELIMKVTGHKNYEQFRAYVKVDDEDLETAFSEKF
ncbi:tyrosine-type recombinase/integrase [Taibaiella soli]|uniref:tyrosine-type recombinase/integrase n=1 Tax=Taibaiella soli TaxID=1649169 RepID=UPI003743C80F